MDGKIGMFIVKCSNIAAKSQAINNKRNLRGSLIFISQDRTLAEREIQRKIAKIAKDEEQDENQVKIWFKKLMINERHYVWKEGDGLVESFRHEANGAHSRPPVGLLTECWSSEDSRGHDLPTASLEEGENNQRSSIQGDHGRGYVESELHDSSNDHGILFLECPSAADSTRGVQKIR